MKGLTLKIAVMVAATLIAALPVLAAEGIGSERSDLNQQGQKDECLLVAKNCGDNVDSIQQRIDRISHEIGKGTAVYTDSELRRLDSQLRDANSLLATMLSSGA